MTPARLLVLLGVFGAIPWLGCVTKPIVRAPPQVPTEKTRGEEVRRHLIGAWESAGKSAKPKQMIFESDGDVRFEGGLEYFNPGRWEWDSSRSELRMTLSQADDEKLQVFQLYVGDGVKAFDRRQKSVTYAFGADTWNINVAGWIYSKAENVSNPVLPEPILK